MKRVLSVVFLLFFPLSAHAVVDLAISQSDIRFSEDTLVAGDEVRIYASVHNVGDEDVSGYVTFYQGATLIGDSLVISVLAGGNPEEIYVDFIVPSSEFNIMAQMKGADPADANPENDVAITSILTPLRDDDRDGVRNEDDNCPAVENVSQADADGDAQGDACDSDDDNDELSDEVETELGSDTTNPDSDSDGAMDAEDAYPTDAEKTTIESNEIETLEEESVDGAQDGFTEAPENVEASDAFQKIVEEVAKAIQETVSETEEIEVEKGEAIFRYEREDWNTFAFEVVAPSSESVVYVWDFGDGTTSSKSSVSHSYQSSGAFLVTLTMADETGVISQESTTILVPFFHLQNRLVILSLIFLVILLGVAINAFVRFGGKKSTN